MSPHHKTVSLALLPVLVCACSSPEPPEALVDLQTEFGEVYGTSTEAGILALSPLTENRDQLAFRYSVGEGRFDDVARVERRGDWLAVLTPASSRPNQARLAIEAPAAEEALYLESRDAAGAPLLLDALLLEEGERGDFLVLDDGRDTEEAARELAGCGVYVLREGYLQLAGLLNGVYMESPEALAFIGIDEISRMLPASASYFERKSLPKRSDFEYGIPRDFRGESPGGAGAGPVPLPGGEEPPPPPEVETNAADDPGLDELLKSIEDG